MPTGTILLYPGALVLPATGFAQAQIVQSTGTEPANAPDVFWEELLFDPTVDETVMFAFRMPQDYASGGTIFIQARTTAITGSAQFKAGVAAMTPAADVITTKIFNTVSSSTAAAVPGTASTVFEHSISPNMDSVAAGDYVEIFVGRDADNGDTVTVDIGILAVAFEYTTN